jgi:hypothetical protein
MRIDFCDQFNQNTVLKALGNVSTHGALFLDEQLNSELIKGAF